MPAEGTLPTPNVGLLNKLPHFQISMVKNIYDRAVRRSFASCWHMSDSEPTEYVWDEFGGHHDGIAIRTTPTKIQSALSNIWGSDGPVHFGKVGYIDHYLDVIPADNVIEAAFVVDDGYQRENEARILIHTDGSAAANKLARKRGPYGDLVVRPSQEEIDAGNGGFNGGHNEVAVVPSANSNAYIEQILIGKNVSGARREQLVQQITDGGLASKIHYEK
jgi:hypothetical protein